MNFCIMGYWVLISLSEQKWTTACSGSLHKSMLWLGQNNADLIIFLLSRIAYESLGSIVSSAFPSKQECLHSFFICKNVYTSHSHFRLQLVDYRSHKYEEKSGLMVANSVWSSHQCVKYLLTQLHYLVITQCNVRGSILQGTNQALKPRTDHINPSEITQTNFCNDNGLIYCRYPHQMTI